MDQTIKDKFRSAIQANDIQLVKLMLVDHPTLVGQDLRPEEAQDHFTNGYALVEASKLNHTEISLLLLEAKADPNAAKLPETEDPPEFGLPLCLAVEHRNYELANRLLDYGASVNAFPFCSRSLVEEVHLLARADGASIETPRLGLANYLGEYDLDFNLELNSWTQLGFKPKISSHIQNLETPYLVFKYFRCSTTYSGECEL